MSAPLSGGARAGELRTHSVPFQVLKYCTIWFRFASETGSPASALLFLLTMVLWSVVAVRVADVG